MLVPSRAQVRKREYWIAAEANLVLFFCYATIIAEKDVKTRSFRFLFLCRLEPNLNVIAYLFLV